MPVISVPPRPASRTHKHAQRRTTKSQNHGTRPVYNSKIDRPEDVFVEYPVRMISVAVLVVAV